MKVVIEAKAGGDGWQWTWKFVAANGAALAVSAYPHATRRRCLRAVERFVAAVRTGHIKAYEKGKYIGEVVASYSEPGATAGKGDDRS